MAKRPSPTRRTPPNDRRQRLAEIQREQKARERRSVLTIVGVCGALVVLLAGFITYGIIDGKRTADANRPSNKILTLGTAASQASCDPPTTDPATGQGTHVGPGTDKPQQLKVDYATVPPSTGPHFAQPALDGRGYYTAADSPAVETLVHNLEHGYTVLWYLSSEEQSQGATLKQVAEVGAKLDPSKGKFIVAPWNDAYGAFPAGKKYALVHWSATQDAQGQMTSQAGHRQLCGGLSGQVVLDFVTKYPRTDAPEPNGA